MQKKNFLPILALAVGHLVTDLQAGALPIVLPHLKELFTLSYSQLAAIVLTQNITSSVIQPILRISDLCLSCCLFALLWQVQGLPP